MAALLVYVEIVTKPDQECVTSSEQDHAMKCCELAGLRLPAGTFHELAVLYSKECVDREAPQDSLNIFVTQNDIFTKDRYSDLSAPEKEKAQDHVLWEVLTDLGWKPESGEVLMKVWLDRGIAAESIRQTARDELSIIKRAIGANTLEEKKAARQELRDKAAMKLVRQFSCLPFGVSVIQALDKALLEHEQFSSMADRLQKLLDRMNSTGTQDQITRSNSAVQVTTQCVRLRGEVSQILCLAGGKEEVAAAREAHKDILGRVEGMVNAASTRAFELNFRVLDHAAEKALKPYVVSRTKLVSDGALKPDKHEQMRKILIAMQDALQKLLSTITDSLNAQAT